VNGRKKKTTIMKRYRFGRISQFSTACVFPRVVIQNRRRKVAREAVRSVARR
jgi:hypothetical protein